jgi:predicted nucleic acid-binding Zn ribbon protein
MPTYEYRCEANGRTVEVSHPMREKLTTWGQVCTAAGVDPGTTPASAPVEKLLSLSFVAGKASGGTQAGGHSGGGQSCGPGCGCH